jgi:hypothetical protein
MPTGTVYPHFLGSKSGSSRSGCDKKWIRSQGSKIFVELRTIYKYDRGPGPGSKLCVITKGTGTGRNLSSSISTLIRIYLSC